MKVRKANEQEESVAEAVRNGEAWVDEKGMVWYSEKKVAGYKEPPPPNSGDNKDG